MKGLPHKKVKRLHATQRKKCFSSILSLASFYAICNFTKTNDGVDTWSIKGCNNILDNKKQYLYFRKKSNLFSTEICLNISQSIYQSKSTRVYSFIS